MCGVKSFESLISAETPDALASKTSVGRRKRFMREAGELFSPYADEPGFRSSAPQTAALMRRNRHPPPLSRPGRPELGTRFILNPSSHEALPLTPRAGSHRTVRPASAFEPRCHLQRWS